MTIPTEDSTPAPAQSSAYRDASQSAGPGAAEHRVFSEHNDMLVFLLCVSGALWVWGLYDVGLCFSLTVSFFCHFFFEGYVFRGYFYFYFKIIITSLFWFFTLFEFKHVKKYDYPGELRINCCYCQTFEACVLILIFLPHWLLTLLQQKAAAAFTSSTSHNICCSSHKLVGMKTGTEGLRDIMCCILY